MKQEIIANLTNEFKNNQKVLTAIGDETRQAILMTLIQGQQYPGMRVGEIKERTHLSRPAVSHHLRILKDAQIISVRKEGAWTTDLGYNATKKAFEHTCKKLKVEYLDMYLIHFASPHYVEAWKAMEELYSEGRIKVIGVANFEIQHLEHLMAHSRIPPMINQIETHPEFPQNELHDYLVQHRISHEAWGPLGQGNKALLDRKELAEIARHHKKSAAQVILRWHLQRGIIVIPKSSNPKRIKENSEIFDFELTAEEMEKVNRLNTGKRYSVNPTGYIVNPFYVKLMKLFIR
ncbi:aldo/keto reductase [Paenibacillus sp. FSL L8-0436]|uniref:aldo/keto reductase n=1 Tax=Paenibacillus sp. FSL L8-0436 TaxID=2954686 RepID=UPI00315943FD